MSQTISEQFTLVNNRFDAMDTRLFGVEQKLVQHDKWFDEIDSKLNHIYSVLDSHMKRIEDIISDNVARDNQQDRLEK